MERRKFTKAVGVAVAGAAVAGKAASEVTRMKQTGALVPRLDGFVDFTSPENERGLPMRVEVRGDTAFSTVTIPEHMSGWHGGDQVFAHKGAVATILDTVMAFGGIYLLKRATVTKSISIEHFAQVPLNTELRAEARLVQRRGDNEAILESALKDAGGTVVARSKGTYALYSVDQLRNPSTAASLELLLAPGANLADSGAIICYPQNLAAFEKMLQSL